MIKWQGYGEDENKWIRTEFMHCPVMVKEFEESLKLKEVSKTNSQTSSKDNDNDIHATKSQNLDGTSSDTPQIEHPTHENPTKTTNAMNNTSDEKQEPERPLIPNNPFHRGLKVEMICGAIKLSPGRMFLIKWKGVEKPELVPTELVNKHCPQLVIKFYEERCNWNC